MPDDCGFAAQQDAANPGRVAHQLTEQPGGDGHPARLAVDRS
jgi:hypothetical protein